MVGDEMAPPDVDYGPQVGAQYGAPYDYIKEQGLPFIMQQEGGAYQPGSFYNPDEMPPPPNTYCRCMTWFGFRHSYTHGRNVGWGLPLVGSSWLNRPHYIGATLGPMWLTNRPANSVPRDVDVIGSLILRLGLGLLLGQRISVRLCHARARQSLRAARLADRPSLRPLELQLHVLPVGRREFAALLAAGHRRLAFRFHATDDGAPLERMGALHALWRRHEVFIPPLARGPHRVHRPILLGRPWHGHQHNLTLNFGLEVRFGGKRKAYWPWNPSRHIW